MSNYLIIGTSSGIGKKLAEQLVDSGQKVYATYFKNKPETNVGLPDYHYLNVLDENIPLDFLPDTLDGLVYCPGSINLRPFERIKPGDFVTDFNLQVTGAIKIIQAAFLLSEKSSWISGQIFHVDGGMSSLKV